MWRFGQKYVLNTWVSSLTVDQTGLLCNWWELNYRVHLIYYLKFENLFLLPFPKSYAVALFIAIYITTLYYVMGYSRQFRPAAMERFTL